MHELLLGEQERCGLPQMPRPSFLLLLSALMWVEPLGVGNGVQMLIDQPLEQGSFGKEHHQRLYELTSLEQRIYSL